jgi:hypothetical protein
MWACALDWLTFSEDVCRSSGVLQDWFASLFASLSA